MLDSRHCPCPVSRSEPCGAEMAGNWLKSHCEPGSEQTSEPRLGGTQEPKLLSSGLCGLATAHMHLLWKDRGWTVDGHALPWHDSEDSRLEQTPALRCLGGSCF